MTVTSALKSAAPGSIKLPPSNGAANGHSTGPKTPKTPQDEAIAFFGGQHDGEAVQVWELALEDDGGPGEAKSVS